MASNIQPTGLDWKNLPQKTTPISAENLNKMANTIDDLVEAVNPLNTVEANPTGTPTEGLEKVEIDGTLYEVKGGHKILNDSGTTLTQKDNLQFKGVYTQNNGDNTEVDICRTMTKAQMEALSGEELKGFINTSDEPDSLPLTAEWVAYGNGSVEDGLDNKVSKTGDTMTGDLTIDGTSSSRLFLGNNTSDNIRGIIRMHNTNGKFVQLYPNNTSADRNIELPDKSGTVALTSDFDIETKSECSLIFKKSGKVVSVYGSLENMSQQSNINLGTCTYKPTNYYAVFPLFQSTSPYPTIGSIWIGEGGSVEVYKPTATTKAYVYGTYVCK